MQKENAHKLRRLNNDFYAAVARSFSETRDHAWPGWERLVSHVPMQPGGDVRVIDVACGNLRFEKFLLERWPDVPWRFDALDSCAELPSLDVPVRVRKVDVLSRMLEGDDPLPDVPPWSYALVACFGFLHHVPSFDLRATLLRNLIERAEPGGVVAVSLWRFASDPALRAKAERTTAKLQPSLDVSLDEGDFLLGWQGRADVARYCHSFADQEVDALAAAVEESATLVDRYESDGRTGNLNSYLIWKR